MDASRSKPGLPGSSTTADPSAYEMPARSSELGLTDELSPHPDGEEDEEDETHQLPHSVSSFGLRAARFFFGASIACAHVRRS